ncbi:porin [Ideonella sp. YS5]|uniref:porin n=1 Tax=Ideonella sp. YS5 TaxID=3453714 RepID=UPI003EE96084
MWKLLWATGFSAASLGAAAQSSVTIGGTLDAGMRQVRNGSLGTDRSVVSGANSTSKLIVRANEDLGGGLSAGIYLDATILADTGGAGANTPAGQFWDRRSTVNLAHGKLGELRLGRDWVPTHLVWSGFDPFTTLGIASANSFRSFAGSRALGQAFGPLPDAQQANPTLRVSNAVEYFLPSDLGGLYGSVIKTAGERGTTAAGFTSGDGLRLGWSGRGFNVAAAQFTTRNAAGGESFKDLAYGLSYDFGVAKVNIAQRRWTFGPDKTVNTLVAATFPAGSGVVKLSWLQADQSGSDAVQNAKDANLLGLGYVYSFSKRTAVYGHAARVANKGTAAFAIPGGPPTSGVPNAPNYFGGQTSTAFEAGIRHDF